MDGISNFEVSGDLPIPCELGAQFSDGYFCYLQNYRLLDRFNSSTRNCLKNTVITPGILDIEGRGLNTIRQVVSMLLIEESLMGVTLPLTPLSE